MHIPNINIDDYNYSLPKEKIAEFPAVNRSESKLLIVNRHCSALTHASFTNIAEYLPSASLLVINDTKVIPARILMKKPTGGAVEVFCIEPNNSNISSTLLQNACSHSVWKAIIGGRNVNPGMELVPLKEDANNSGFRAYIVEKYGSDAVVQFLWDSDELFANLLLRFGAIPLPPYIKREPEPLDKERYQTVYAASDGSVAAPTAGLHFTPEIFSELPKKRIERLNITLHVGPGTFKPVESDSIAGHDMHSEQFLINESAIVKLIDFLKNRKQISKLIAVGTTSVRTLESLYWLGVLLKREIDPFKSDCAVLDQWTCYELAQNGYLPSAEEALAILLESLSERNLRTCIGRTRLLIAPGYKFRLVEALITNFHLPKSTLLLLVSAFLEGNLWRDAYQSALANDYRFLSYGDSSLLL